MDSKLNIRRNVELHPRKNSEESLCFDFSGSASVNACIRSIELNEGISIPYTAVLAVDSTKSFSVRKLRELIRLPVSLLLREQSISSAGTVNNSYERRLEGIITRVIRVGELPSYLGSDAQIYRYKITVEPEIIMLDKNRKPRSYTADSSVYDVIKDVFKDNGVEMSIPSSLYPNEDIAAFSTGFIYEKRTESDLEFISRLCFPYGLNYNFCFDSNDDRSAEDFKVVFSGDWSTLSSVPVFDMLGSRVYKLQMQGEHAAPAVLDCVVRPDTEVSFEENVIKSYSFDLNIDAYENTDESNAQFCARSLVSFTPEARRAKELKERIFKEKLKSVKSCFNNFSNRVLVESGDIRYMPGLMLRIENLDERYLIARAVTEFTCTPNSFEQKITGPDITCGITQKLLCFSADEDDILGPLSSFSRLSKDATAADCTALCAPFAEAESSHSHTASSIAASLRSQTLHKGAGSAVHFGVVTNAEGLLEVKNSDGSTVNLRGQAVVAKGAHKGRPDLFYVRLDSSDDVVSVSFVSHNFGVQANGNFPLIGSRVIIIGIDNQFFFLGYLPDSLGFMGNDSRFTLNSAASRVYSGLNTEDHDLSDFTDYDMDISALQFSTRPYIEGVICDMLLKGRLASYIESLSNSQENTGPSDRYFKSDNTLTLTYKRLSVDEYGDETALDESAAYSYSKWPDELKRLLRIARKNMAQSRSDTAQSVLKSVHDAFYTYCSAVKENIISDDVECERRQLNLTSNGEINLMSAHNSYIKMGKSVTIGVFGSKK